MMTLKFYRTRSLLRSERFRWRLTAPNGRRVGASTEGYTNRADCKINAQLVTGYENRTDITVTARW